MAQANLAAYSGKRVLVTGGLGFMGFNLVRTLQAAEARLSVLSRSWPQPGGLESNLGGGAFFQGDIRDAAVVDDAGTGCDLIFHPAGKSGSMANNASPLDAPDVDNRGTPAM